MTAIHSSKCSCLYNKPRDTFECRNCRCELFCIRPLCAVPCKTKAVRLFIYSLFTPNPIYIQNASFFFAWKTKSQRLCPDKACVIQRDEHNKRSAGQRCYSEDRYRWPADYDNNVQDGALEFFPEGTVGMWGTNKLINDIDEIGFSCVTMLQMRKAPVCLCVLQTNKEFVHFLNVCPCLYLQNQLSTAVNLHISACVHLFESLKGVSPSSNQDSIIIFS